VTLTILLCTFQHLDFIVKINLLKELCTGRTLKKLLYESFWYIVLVQVFVQTSNLCGLELHMILFGARNLYKKIYKKACQMCKIFVHVVQVF